MNFVVKIYEKTLLSDKNKDQPVGEKTKVFTFSSEMILQYPWHIKIANKEYAAKIVQKKYITDLYQALT